VARRGILNWRLLNSYHVTLKNGHVIRADRKPLLQSAYYFCICKNTSVKKTFLCPLEPISIKKALSIRNPDPCFSRFSLETTEATPKGMEAHGAELLPHVVLLNAITRQFFLTT